LFLTQARQLLQGRFNVKITYRNLMEDVPSLGALAAYIDQQLPPETKPRQPPPRQPLRLPSDPGAHRDADRAILAARRAAAGRKNRGEEPGLQSNGDAIRWRLFCKNNSRLSSASSINNCLCCAKKGLANTVNPSAPFQLPTPGLDSKKQATRNDTAISHAAAPLPTSKGERTGFGPYQPPRQESGSIFTPGQSKWLEDFVARYNERTARSKALAQAQRKAVADPRSIANFRLLWKELVYQIVVERAEGARLWDIDGNEYIDVTMGFGVNLFGHSPQFIREAAFEQLRKGVAIGPQSALTGEVAELVREFTGMERVTFCNTGSEAVLAALRVARTVTGRPKVAYFSGDYHGMFDEVLCRSYGSGSKLRAVPVAPGLPPSAGEDILIFEYGQPDTLERLREHAGELAAVLVEPVQSRHPDLQPKAFLEELRRLTKEAGVLLIFDEVITGFRIHPGGAQAIFGVRPDLAAYGKVAGGGFPIGILAGRSDYMAALDGGDWRFGDDSSPEADMTFFAGTFVRHPLALAAAKASLLHLKECGPALQQQLNEKTASLVKRLNASFEERNAPMQLQHFGSLFRFHFHPAWPFAPLFVYHALEKGIYFREAHQNCFLSTAHTNDDVERIVSAFQACSRLLEEAGLGTTPGKLDPPRTEPNTPALKMPAGMPHESVSTQLTEGQREIWQACQLSPEASCAYNESFNIRFKGRMETARMQQAIQAVVARHEALRARIHPTGETFSIVSSSEFQLEVPVEDLSGLSGSEQTQRLAAIQAEEARTPFDLEKGPLVRIRLGKIANDEHVLVFNAHHLVCDGESSGVILADLGGFYSALCHDTEPALAPASSFCEFAAAEARRIGSKEDAEDEKWWRERFATPVPILALPVDHSRPSSQAARAGMSRAILSKETTQKLRRAGAAMGCTLFGTLFAAFTALLHRLSGQDDFAVGIFASVPSMSGWKDLVGHGISLLPIRSRVEPDREPGFREFARTLQSLTMDAQEHGHYTYGRLVRELRVPRHGSCAPIVQAVFNLDRKESKGPKFGDLTAEITPNAHAAVVFDLFLNVRETTDQLFLDLEHNADVFEPGTVQRWLHHYQALLEAAVAQPQTVISALPLLTPSEKQEVLATSRGPRLTVPSLCLHELFEAQAQRTPKAIALTWVHEDMTYRELDRRANELAEHLRRLGTAPESLVAICLERQPALIVSLLAVLKAGGAYVPLDPRYPQERLSYIIENSGASVILTTSSLQEKLRLASPQLTIVEIDRSPPAPKKSAKRAEAGAAFRATPDGLAYVIYTSGSTGRPKGVGIEHRNAVAFVQWVKQVFSPEELAGVLASTSVCFDLSVFEIFGTLSHGGRVILAENALECATLPARDEIRLINSVPSIMAELLRSGALPPSVRTVNLAGEPLSRELVRELYACPGMEKVYDLYGPSETTTYSSVALRQPDQPPTIGRPIAGTDIYVVDSNLEPVPPGICGELLIGGAGVGRGYLHQPEITSAKFIPDPWSTPTDGRLYRTGDRGRYRTDNNLELLGRMDDQVKVRGFRIELGEVESVLSEHPSVADCAVTVQTEPGSDDKQLVACIVPASAEAIQKTGGDDEWLKDIVAQFESGYGLAIRENADEQSQDPTLNIYAWSGLERTEQEVADWIEGLASRLLATKPNRLLEIGCGTGLLLFRLASEVDEYWATDLSRAALDDIRRRLGPAGLSASRVKLFEKMAHDFSSLPVGHFDAVILNGVIEYFPNIDYLLRVLKGAVRLLTPDGFVFLGAVPNLAAQETLHMAGELGRAPDSEDAAAFRRRVRNRMAADRRLLVTPEFFRALPKEIPELTAVKIQTLPGSFENEASRLLADASFDVVLKTRVGTTETRTVHRLDWKSDALTPEAVLKRLSDGDKSAVWYIRHVPSPRVRAYHDLLMSWPATGNSAADLKKRIASGTAEPGLTELLAGCARLEIHADVSWSNSGADGMCDVVIYRGNESEPSVGQELRVTSDHLGVHANDPQRAQLMRRLVPELRRFLHQKLPEHLVPTKFVLLDRMPRTPNGKRDRKALEKIDAPVVTTDEPSVEPRTPAETALAQIWCSVLGLPRVGIHDNFFDLGGHSLLVAQVMGRVRDAFEVEMPMRRMFEHPTIASLAAAVEEGLVETIQTLTEAEAERLATAPGVKEG
jgi:amino acid adenylation domain-containing protein